MYLLPVRGGSVPIRRLPTANDLITKKKSQPMSIPGASLFIQDVWEQEEHRRCRCIPQQTISNISLYRYKSTL